MSTAGYWCEWAWLGGTHARPGVLLEVDGDTISDVLTDHPRPHRDVTVLDGITLPAFANAHSHAFHRALRGRTHGERGSFWTWRDLMYRAAGRLDPENYYRLARATFAEMTLAGVGVVGEFHYVHHRVDGRPYSEPNEMGRALVEAAQSVGIRLTLLDAIYRWGGLDAATGVHRPLEQHQLRFADPSVSAWGQRVADAMVALSRPRVRVGAAIHSVRAMDADGIAAVAEWGRQETAPLHVHVSEQPLENQQSLEVYGRTPLAVLADAGALGSTTTAIHGTHLTPGDIELLARSGAALCLCPTTERDLADGTGPSAAVRAAGVPLCVGSDSHAIIDMLEEIRAVELNQRIVTLQRGVHTTAELLTAATAVGYRSLGWPEGGSLAIGSAADFTTVSRSSVRLSGGDDRHVLDDVVFSATAADVEHLVVAGRTVVNEGAHVDLDVAAELDQAIGAVMSP